MSYGISYGTASLPRPTLSLPSHINKAITPESPLLEIPLPEKRLPERPRKYKFLSRNVGWRPATLKLPFLLTFALLTAAIIALLEYFNYLTHTKGAVVFSNGTGYVAYSFQYVPLIVAVIYGLLWASLDHDVKRLEPYFQLSKAQGVTPANSLLLDYPHIFAPFTPLVAVRKRHWVVAISAFVGVLNIYGVTPLMSTVLQQADVQRVVKIPVRHAGLMPAEKQRGGLSTAWSYVAYSHQYLNGSLPPFATEDYAVLPFRPVASDGSMEVGNWTAESTLFEGAVTCSPGTISPDPKDTGFAVVASKEKNCSFSMGMWDDSGQRAPFQSILINKRVLQASAVNRTHGSSAPKDVHCPGNDDMMAAVFRTAMSKPSFDVAIFCEPVNTQQQVLVTVDAKSGEVKELQRKGEKTGFNGLDMEYWNDLLVGLETSASTPDFNVSQEGRVEPGKRDEAAMVTSMTAPNVKGWNLPDHSSMLFRNKAFHTRMNNHTGFEKPHDIVSWNTTSAINTYLVCPRSMMGFGLSEQKDLEKLSDPERLADMYNGAYRKLFAMALSAGLPVFDNSSAPTQGLQKYQTAGYVIDSTWLRILEVILVLALALNIALIVLLWNRRCDIASDPGTLASALAWVDPAVLQDFRDAEFLSPDDLAKALEKKGHRYYLKDHKVVSCGGRHRAPILRDESLDRTRVTKSKPWDLNLMVGVFAMICLLVWILVLTVLYVQSKRDRGFKVPGNKFAYSIYASYIPTVAATLLESYLALLGTRVAILFPFKMLNRGHATATESLTVNYEQTPPHLQVVSALKVKNVLLAVLSVSILLSNALTVVVGGMFTKKPTVFVRDVNVTLKGSPEALKTYNPTENTQGDFNSDPEFFYAGTGGTLGFSPRPWTTDDLFYIPFSGDQGSNYSHYTVDTWGLGLDVSCELIPDGDLRLWHSLVFNSSSMSPSTDHTFSFYTFKAANDTSIIFPQYVSADNVRYKPPLGFEFLTTEMFMEGFFNQTKPIAYYELAPERYPSELAQRPEEFYASWVKYEAAVRDVEVDRNMNQDIVLSKRRVVQDVSAGNPNHFTETDSGAPTSDIVFSNVRADNKQKSIGKTYHGPTAFVSKKSAIHCIPTPRLVQSELVADLAGNIISHQDTDLPLSDAELAKNDTGIPGLLSLFQTMMLRINTDFTDGARKTDPRPSNWLSFLLNQHAREVQPDFDLYSYPEQSAKSMEVVYKKLFAIFLQLHAEEMFPSKAELDGIPTQHTVTETRVVMLLPAFIVAVTLLVAFIMPVVWTYVALQREFLCHPPTTLAGTYAAFYASSVRDDVKGTEMMGSRQRESWLRKKDGRYGYGWFIGEG
jgi:hypothetical protein